MGRTSAEATDLRGLKTTSITDPAINAAVSTEIVDTYSGVIITTTTTGNAQTIQTPTNTTSIKRFSIINNDTSTDDIVVNGETIAPGEVKYFIWDGTAWVKDPAGSTGTAWGDITGTLSNQTDLQNELDGKQDSLPVADTTAITKGSIDDTKLSKIEVDGNSTGVTGTIAMAFTTDKTITLPDATDTLVGKDTSDTLTNKTIDLTDNTLTGTKAEFDTAVSDGDFAYQTDITIESDPSGVTGADQVTNVMSLTTAEYGAITPNASTLYIITDA